jgi:hypothetical protein
MSRSGWLSAERAARRRAACGPDGMARDSDVHDCVLAVSGKRTSAEQRARKAGLDGCLLGAAEAEAAVRWTRWTRCVASFARRAPMPRRSATPLSRTTRGVVHPCP